MHLNRIGNRPDDIIAVWLEKGDQKFLIIFDEDTPYHLIKQISPDIIVKGGDYTPDNVVGNDIAKVKIFNYVDGYSTTNIVNKL